MNIKLDGQQLRLRLSTIELDTLLTESRLISSTQLPQQPFSYGVALINEGDDSEPSVDFDGTSLTLKIPRASINNTEGSHILSRHGVQGQVRLDDEHSLQFALQVDLRDRKQS